jgi:multidrug efflux system membrane fusion protein
VPVTAEIDSTRKFWLRPGSFASVSVKLTSPRQFPMIPQAAARPSDHGFVAFVVEGDTAHERVLQLGMHTADGWVEVRDGLKEGEQIVTRGAEALAEGTKVQVVPAAPAGSALELVGPPATSGSAQAEARKRRSPGGSPSATPASATSAAPTETP